MTSEVTLHEHGYSLPCREACNKLLDLVVSIMSHLWVWHSFSLQFNLIYLSKNRIWKAKFVLISTHLRFLFLLKAMKRQIKLVEAATLTRKEHKFILEYIKMWVGLQEFTRVRVRVDLKTQGSQTDYRLPPKRTSHMPW